MTARPSTCRRRRRCVWRWQTPGALAPLPAKLRCEELLKGTGHSASLSGPSFYYRRLVRTVSSSFAVAATGCTALPCARCRCAADGVFEGTEEGARRRWRQHPKPGHWPLGLALRRRRVEVIKKSAWRTQPPAARQLVMVEGGAGGDGVVLIVNLRNIHESVIELQAPAWSPVPAPRGRKVQYPAPASCLYARMHTPGQPATAFWSASSQLQCASQACAPCYAWACRHLAGVCASRISGVGAADWQRRERVARQPSSPPRAHAGARLCPAWFSSGGGQRHRTASACGQLGAPQRTAMRGALRAAPPP